MSRTLFTQLPTTVLEVMTASRQIDHDIATQILHYAAEWAKSDTVYQLELINYLVYEVETQGRQCWDDIKWRCLVNRIKRLSHEINNNVNGLSACSSSSYRL